MWPLLAISFGISTTCSEIILTFFAFSKLYLFGNLLLRRVQSKHLHCLVEILHMTCSLSESAEFSLCIGTIRIRMSSMISFMYWDNLIIDTTFGWIVASLRPVSKLLQRKFQARLNRIGTYNSVNQKLRNHKKGLCWRKNEGNLKTAVTSSSSRSVRRFGLFVMFVHTRTCVRTELSTSIQEELLW